MRPAGTSARPETVVVAGHGALAGQDVRIGTVYLQQASDAGARTLTDRRSFDERYRRYVAERHAKLEVAGLDLSRADHACWPLDAAYLSLELAEASQRWTEPDEESKPPTVVVKRAEQALAGRPRVLVRGLAGGGKTTLLQWLAVATAGDRLPAELADWKGRTPFILSLRTVTRRGPLPRPRGFLAAMGASLADAQPEGWADRLLSRGEALVLIDGVDEVPQEQRDATRAWLRELLASYPEARFVVTTRPSAVAEGWLASSGFTELTVRPMTATDTALFIERWHTAARHDTDSDAERAHLHDLEAALKVTVRAQRDLSQLSTTPLMCALICALHRDRRGHLPHSRMELYDAALSMLLVRRDRERDITCPEGIQLTRLQTVQLLQKLAYWLLRNRQAEMDLDTALALVADALPAMRAVSEQGTAPQVLAHLMARSGLLRQPTPDTVDFLHRTFQDYLGAKAAVEARDFPLLVNSAHDDQWEDVIRMAVGHARPHESADLLRRLLDRGEAQPEHRSRLHLLAAASLHYGTEIAPETRTLVERSADALMPPRSPEEADALAALGSGILDLLPGPGGLQEDEMDAVIRTAATIGGDQAFAFLQKFTRSLPVSSAPYELMRSWGHFDADHYAQDILLPLKGRLMLTVQTPEQRGALRLLSPVANVCFRAAFTSAETAEFLSAEHTDHLQILDGRLLTDVGFIRELCTLRSLALFRCNRLHHLEDLAGLPLRSLRLGQLPQSMSFDALSSLRRLRELALGTLLPWRSLADLPAPAGITNLFVGGLAGASLTGISRWPLLEKVTIGAEPDAVEWQELTALPHLTTLHVADCDLSEAVPMPGISNLALSPQRSDTRLDLVPELFPNLERLSLYCRNWAPDITPLRELKGLRLTLRVPGNVIGLTQFSPDKVSLVPRPRLSPWQPAAAPGSPAAPR